VTRNLTQNTRPALRGHAPGGLGIETRFESRQFSWDRAETNIHGIQTEPICLALVMNQQTKSLE